MDLTIGMLETRNRKNGSPITNINSDEDLEKVRASAAGKEKDQLPVLTAYRGVRGEYKPSNVFFVDIDTKEGVDKIIANPEKLFDNFRIIYFIQKSYSGKLHICGIFAEKIHLFFARDLVRGNGHPDDGEFLEVLQVPYDQVLDMVRRGEIKDGKTLAGILKASLLMQEQKA